MVTKERVDLAEAMVRSRRFTGLNLSDYCSVLDKEVEKQFGELDRDFKEAIDKSYLDAEFQLGAEKLRFEEKALHRMVLEFGQAIMFLQKMYKDYLDNTPWDLDFEVDLSAVAKVLTPQEHYFLVNE